MTALIAAAGYSRRAKAFKPLLPLGERVVIEQTIDSFSSTCSRVVVVGGYNYALLKSFFEESSFLNGLKLEISLIYNEEYHKGMFSSIKAGVRQIGPDPFFFTPADIPGVKRETIETLSQERGDVVLPSVNNRSGHPVKLSGNVKESILRAHEGDTLRDVLNKYEKKYVSLEDEAILMDLDTPEDYQRMVSYFKKR